MIESKRILRPVMAFAAAAALVWGGAAFAQQGSPGERGPGSPPGDAGSPPGGAGSPPGAPDASQFADEDLEAFADAQEEVQKVGERYRSKLGQGGDDPAKRMELRQQMQEELAEAVRASGLDIGTYNAIASAAQNDPALLKKIEGLR